MFLGQALFEAEEEVEGLKRGDLPDFGVREFYEDRGLSELEESEEAAPDVGKP